MAIKVNLLDVGKREYGDSILCQFEDRFVLIDGAHPGDQDGSPGHRSIPDQLGALMERRQPPYNVDLLIVTHAHSDHIGCLPTLVADGTLTADYALVADPSYGWGRSDADGSSPIDAVVGGRVRSLVAALREEPLAASRPDEVAELMADAASLETRYLTMLDTLRANKTKVFRHGRDKPAALLKAFENIGLQILGPSEAQMKACADEIAQAVGDMIHLADALLRQDAALTTTDAYLALTRGEGFADAVSERRPGDAINLQSVVTAFESGDVKALLAGDIQWVSNSLRNRVIDDEVKALREDVKKAGPFDFAKISHHGSDNAFDASVLDQLGSTRNFGICAGEDSSAHPNPEVLQLLQSRPGLRWARTDHNGLSTFSLSPRRTTIKPERGRLNDPVPNEVDEGPIHTELEAIGEAGVTSTLAGGVVEVVARIPSAPTRVSLIVEIQPGAQSTISTAPGTVRSGPQDVTTDLRIAPDRSLRGILVVSNRARLASNIGAGECEAVFGALRTTDATVIDVPSDRRRTAQVVAMVREAAGGTPKARGIVVLGGYDVVPSVIVDCLPQALRRALGDTDDGDNFLVWSDDPFGDVDSDGVPSIAVSRVPDANSAQLVFAQLGATNGRRPVSRQGVRNIKRPFAGAVYELISQDAMPTSELKRYDDDRQPVRLTADWVYLMLHGDFDDTSRFWGENDDGPIAAVAATSFGTPGPRIVFAGSCWGALIVDRRASRADPLLPLASKPVESSMALSALGLGALAFIGCTGSHYSPMADVPSHAGGPMHTAFWRHLADDLPPPEALLQAKLDYLGGMPHGRTGINDRAIEFKILREFCCLGLGW